MFCMFRHQLFHSSLSAILEPLRPAMTIPEVTRCPDGHFHRIIYGLGSYITDYPEQVLLACIVQGWCPKWAFYLFSIIIRCLIEFTARCTALADNLDAEAGQCSHIHTNALLEQYNLKILWDDYGIVGDIIISGILLS
jgi:Plavaka transposase